MTDIKKSTKWTKRLMGVLIALSILLVILTFRHFGVTIKLATTDIPLSVRKVVAQKNVVEAGIYYMHYARAEYIETYPEQIQPIEEAIIESEKMLKELERKSEMIEYKAMKKATIKHLLLTLLFAGISVTSIYFVHVSYSIIKKRN